MRAAAKTLLALSLVLNPFNAAAQFPEDREGVPEIAGTLTPPDMIRERDDLPEAIDRCAFDFIKRKSLGMAGHFSMLAFEVRPGVIPVHIEASTKAEDHSIIYGRGISLIRERNEVSIRIIQGKKSIKFALPFPGLKDGLMDQDGDPDLEIEAMDYMDKLVNCARNHARPQ